MTEPAPSTAATPEAVLFDVDGTLLDTVYQHVIAWWEAFAEAGHTVSGFDIHRAIGRGSDDLVESLIGRTDDALVEAHSQKWAQLRERTTAFHQVPELLRHCRDRGLKVVLCTSGAADDLEFFVRAIGGDEPVHAVVSSEDVAQSKPSPEIVQKAVEAAGVRPDQAVMVGDTVYDIRAAAAAGVRCIGVMCGGIGEQELLDAGAAAVYGNPSELLSDFDQSPLVRS
ncbi:MAG: HAD family hydrolase [Actinobacteria bacterium]|nr:HAD family hydrolase [Actinomycetota bacterium]MCA1720182.1 HAD family hydrolase [Actinomycetota bacterium]